MAKTRIGINGFGRIGRCAAKVIFDRDDVTLVGINDLKDAGDLAYLLRYDSVHGTYREETHADEGVIGVGDRRIPFFASQDPAEVPWKDVGADIVIESSGALRKREKAARHLQGGAKRVVISAPSDDVDGMFVPGVNDDGFDADRHEVVSMASCTTNSLAPVVKVLHDRFGVDNCIFTTVHAYTSSQSLMDLPTRKRRRGRAAAVSIIPTTTGAANATEKVLPELEGRISGMAMRVPVPDGSLTDAVFRLDRDVAVHEVNDALIEAANGPLKGILGATTDCLVSRDIIGNPHSSVIDLDSTMVLRERTVKVLAWYDNEWGYSSRLVDFASAIAKKVA
jgi:glyceraldehyde 3-phosphate dehydrogenase